MKSDGRHVKFQSRMRGRRKIFFPAAEAINFVYSLSREISIAEDLAIA